MHHAAPLSVEVLAAQNLIKRSLSRQVFLVIALLFGCFTLLPIARAVTLAPAGGSPNANTAEGTDALFSLTSGLTTRPAVYSRSIPTSLVTTTQRLVPEHFSTIRWMRTQRFGLSHWSSTPLGGITVPSAKRRDCPVHVSAERLNRSQALTISFSGRAAKWSGTKH